MKNVLPWSVAFLIGTCILVGLQSTVLTFILP